RASSRPGRRRRRSSVSRASSCDAATRAAVVVASHYILRTGRRAGGRDYNAGAVAASVSAADFYERRRAPVLDSFMAYVEVGVGALIVLVHGNQTWSYLWRTVIPLVQGSARCPAPVLSGFGRPGARPPARRWCCRRTSSWSASCPRACCAD